MHPLAKDFLIKAGKFVLFFLLFALVLTIIGSCINSVHKTANANYICELYGYSNASAVSESNNLFACFNRVEGDGILIDLDEIEIYP